MLLNHQQIDVVPDSPDISALFISKLLNRAEQAGVSVDALCNHARISLAQINNEEGRLPYQAYLAILAETARLAGDEFFWLTKYTPDLVPTDTPLGYVIFSAPTLRLAIDRIQSFYQHYSTVHYPACALYPDEFALRLTSDLSSHMLSGYALDWVFAGWWGVSRQFAGPKLKIKLLRLTSEYSSRQWAYQKFFHATVQTNQPHCEIVFDLEQLELANTDNNFDANLDSILLNVVQQTVKEGTQEKDFLCGLHEEIRHQMFLGSLELKTIAERFNTSARSLQRRLEEENTSFSEQVSTVRKELALNYLQKLNLSVSEVATLLGFTSTAAFSAAFNKWFCMSPSQYRRHQSLNASPRL